MKNKGSFNDWLKVESSYRKIMDIDLIYRITNIFSIDCKYIEYPTKIKNAFEFVLNFYKEYNIEYYKIIKKGMSDGRVVINDGYDSFYNINTNTVVIGLQGNDSDIFAITHELAHFVDRNCEPIIIPNDYWFLAETFAVYIEKQLELWLDNPKYRRLIEIKRNNRISCSVDMTKDIENELFYEEIFMKKGYVQDSDVNKKEVNRIVGYGIPNFVNYLLAYPLANLLTDYIIRNNLVTNDKEILKTCLNIDLNELINYYSNNNKSIIKKLIK